MTDVLIIVVAVVNASIVVCLKEEFSLLEFSLLEYASSLSEAEELLLFEFC